MAALQAVWPIPAKEAGQEATNAISYASSNHKEWFWMACEAKTKSKEGAVGDRLRGRIARPGVTAGRPPQTYTRSPDVGKPASVGSRFVAGHSGSSALSIMASSVLASGTGPAIR